MTTKLTRSERQYIHAMFSPDFPETANIKDISEMPLGSVALFMENREEQPKPVYPGDHSISEKYLTFHKLPLTMTYKQWEKWVSEKRGE